MASGGSDVIEIGLIDEHPDSTSVREIIAAIAARIVTLGLRVVGGIATLLDPRVVRTA
jgi:hypothetical protein